jgi:hypothetical protein
MRKDIAVVYDVLETELVSVADGPVAWPLARDCTIASQAGRRRHVLSEILKGRYDCRL